MRKKILIYDMDNKEIEYTNAMLSEEGYQVEKISNEEQIFSELKCTIHMLLFYSNWSNGDILIGCSLLKKIREESDIPIIIVSDNKKEANKIMALNAGADDYVTTDCNPLELLARVNSQIKRYVNLVNLCKNINRIYRVGELEINDIQKRVHVMGREVKLTPIEYKILYLLIQNRGKIFSISQIYESIWNMEAIGADNTIAVHIRHIREKIERNPKDPCYLKVVWGVGYKVG